MIDVLIVEDDPYVQRVYQRLFSLKNYAFEIVSDGKKALEKAKKSPPKVILLDIIMFPIDGLQVLKKLKEDPLTSNIPVIMLTNLGEEEYIKKANTLGASEYMIKSEFEPEDILKVVDKYLKIA